MGTLATGLSTLVAFMRSEVLAIYSCGQRCEFWDLLIDLAFGLLLLNRAFERGHPIREDFGSR